MAQDEIGYVFEAQRKALSSKLPRNAQLGFSDDKFVVQIRDLSAMEVLKLSEYLKSFDS